MGPPIALWANNQFLPHFLFLVSYLEKIPVFFYSRFGVKKNRVGVKKNHPIFCNGKHPYCSKNCHKLCLWTCLQFYIKYFQICTNDSRKILRRFFFTPIPVFYYPTSNLKETCGFFLPRDESNLRGKKKRHFFITKNIHRISNI